MNTCMITLSVLGSIAFVAGYAVVRYGWPKSHMQNSMELRRLRNEVKNLRAALDTVMEQNTTIRARMQTLEFDRHEMELRLMQLRGELLQAARDAQKVNS